MRFGSVASGIEAASVAFGPLGWSAAWLSEIAPFPSAVLAHHYPDVPNLGDMTTISRRVLTGEIDATDVFCGGTPCQAFSVAGLRQSLADERGNLTLKFVEIADAIDHVRTRGGKPECVIFWENVPGVLSTEDNAFGCFLAGLAGEDGALEPPEPRPADGRSSKHWRWNKKLGRHCASWSNAGAVYGPKRAIAWRTLDAQYFGVAQRRRRVFVVASARNGFDPAQVLFEWDGLRRDTAPSRQTGQAAPTIPARSSAGGGLGTDFDCDGVLIEAYGGNNQRGPIDVATARNACASASGRMDFETETFLVQPVHSLRGEGFDASEDGTGRGTPLVPVAVQASQSGVRLNDTIGTLDANYGSRRHNGVMVPIAFDSTQITSAANRANPQPGDPCHPLAAGAHAPAIAFDCKASGQNGFGVGEIASTLRAMGHADSHQNGGGHQAVATGMRVRRLTPAECERLQGFPDGYTRIPNWNGWRDLDDGECPEDLRAQGLQARQSPKTGKWRVNDPDGPRYKALGNSWAIPNVAWIGRRIDAALQKLSS